MCKLPWRDIETYWYACVLLTCTVNLAIISVFVTSRCDAIFLSGDDCGVGYGWPGLAGGFLAIGAFSAWKLYRLLRGRARSMRPETG